MAEKLQIHPRISPESSDALRLAAEARGCAQGDLIEAALTAFLMPEAAPASPLTGRLLQEALAPVVHQLRVLEEAQTALGAGLEARAGAVAALPDTMDTLLAPVCAYLMALEEAMRGVIERCDTLLTRVPAPPPPKPPPPPQRIATYEAMYGPPETWVDPHPMPEAKALPPPKRSLLSRLLFKEV